MGGDFRGVFANVENYDILVSTFELQIHNYAYFYLR